MQLKVYKKIIIGKNKKEVIITNHYSEAKEEWMSKQLVRKIRKRDRLVNKRNKEEEIYRRRDMTRKIEKKNKEIKNEIKIKKNGYFKEKLEGSRNNPKKHWQILNEILKGSRPKRKEIKEIEVNGKKITDQKLCAEEINNYFINIAKK